MNKKVIFYIFLISTTMKTYTSSTSVFVQYNSLLNSIKNTGKFEQIIDDNWYI